jgi:hypothetical protein
MRPIATTDGDSAGVERATAEIGSPSPSVPPSDVAARPTPSGAGRMPWSLDRPGEAGATVLVQPSAPPHRPGRTDPPGRTRWRRVVIVVAAIAILAGAANLASPAIGDWGDSLVSVRLGWPNHEDASWRAAAHGQHR